MAHLINQNVVRPAVAVARLKFLTVALSNKRPALPSFAVQAHEVLCLEMLTLLLERPTDDSVEVSIAFLKECGLKLTEVSPRGINGTSQLNQGHLYSSVI